VADYLKTLFYSATDFCVPGPGCHPDWAAWAAIITFLAVLVPALQHERDRREQHLEKVQRGHASISAFAYDLLDLGGQLDTHKRFAQSMVQMLKEVGPLALADILRLRVSIPKFDAISEFKQITLATSNLDIAVRAFNQVVDVGGRVQMAEPEHHVFAATDNLERMLRQVDHALANAMHAMEATVPGSTAGIPAR